MFILLLYIILYILYYYFIIYWGMGSGKLEGSQWGFCLMSENLHILLILSFWSITINYLYFKTNTYCRVVWKFIYFLLYSTETETTWKLESEWTIIKCSFLGELYPCSSQSVCINLPYLWCSCYWKMFIFLLIFMKFPRASPYQYCRFLKTGFNWWYLTPFS